MKLRFQLPRPKLLQRVPPLTFRRRARVPAQHELRHPPMPPIHHQFTHSNLGMPPSKISRATKRAQRAMRRRRSRLVNHRRHHPGS